MGDPLEVELKLELDPADRAMVQTADLFRGSEGQTAQLVSAYFDTPDRDLDRAGFVLRVRQKGDRRIQTIKAEGAAAAGLFARPEWECDIAGEAPVLDNATSPLRQSVGDAVLAQIEQLFETRVTRTTHVIAIDGATIELAIDEGEVRAGEDSAPLCEIELELLSGPPAALFAAARRLNETVPLRLGVRSKSERGHALASGTRQDKAAKAEPIVLDPAGDPQGAFATIAHACLRHFRLNEALLMRTGEAGAVHQARVALRRLRSAFTLFAPLLDEDAMADRLRADLRWLASALGDVRALDVLIGKTEESLRVPLLAARAHASAQARQDLASPRAQRMMIDLAEWLMLGLWRSHPIDRTLGHFAADRLDRQRRRLKRRSRHIAKLDTEERHKVRIEAKKLRYAAEFFRSLYPGGKARRRYDVLLTPLVALQDHLGELNDETDRAALLDRLDVSVSLPTIGKARHKRLLHLAEEARDDLFDARCFWR